MTRVLRLALVPLLVLVGGISPGIASGAPDRERMALPAVGEALAPRIAVRERPKPEAPVRAVMKAFRWDFRPTVFFAIDRHGSGSREWLKVRIPGRPNGRTGWVRGSRVRLLRSAGPLHILVDRSERRLTLFRSGRVVMKARVAVGTADAPTPLGQFYLTASFRPNDDFLGPWAFETSAYAAITDWPRGGIVGLHGTSEGWSVGKAASHGCLRVHNRVIIALRERVRPGTPLRIRA
ncbi:MAG: L,D-transpeptidase [Solirubrobacterales bacterium]|nr:L,D-transpeptidase [Solirubrobacterales bacterium]